MSNAGMTRRRFVNGCLLTAGSAVMVQSVSSAVVGAAPAKEKLHIATNVYPWITFYRRENKDFNADLDAGLAAVASTGVDGFEPIANNPGDVERLALLLKKQKLQMRSLYVNSILHEQSQIDASIESILAIASKARQETGTRIIVTNPSPINWDGKTSKDDKQLRLQAAAMNQLGAELKKLDVKLSYHNHDMEMKNSAREFHHMMLGTDPDYVTLCLDAHWVYRGSGDSAVALFDIVKLYGKRVSELHIRQSKNNVWTEDVCDGDIDYVTLTTELLQMGVNPHLVIEQAVEAASPKTMNAVQAHKKSTAYARKTFARFAG